MRNDHGSEATAVKRNVRKQQLAIVLHISEIVTAIAVPNQHENIALKLFSQIAHELARRRPSSAMARAFMMVVVVFHAFDRNDRAGSPKPRCRSYTKCELVVLTEGLCPSTSANQCTMS
jgi:hypothetical protein